MSQPEPNQIEGPDLSQRPYKLSVEQKMRASTTAIYQAWTEKFDSWFASPGKIRMHAVENEPYYFEVVHQGKREPHYGRFLKLNPNELIELCWVTGKNGTEGAETVVRIQLIPEGEGTKLVLAHSGFYSETACEQHRQAWPQILVHLDNCLVKGI
jgi:uncharacterized protein YndB with AHSA1/START domain